MQSIYDAFRFQFHNGGRKTIIVLVTLLTILLILTGLNGYEVAGKLLYHPLGYYSLQVSENQRGTDGIPIVHLGEPLLTVAVKCTSYEVVTRGEFNYRRIGDVTQIVPGMSGISKRKAGCETFHFRNVLPPLVTPGLWQISGGDTATEGLFSMLAPYESEVFRVLP